MSLSKSLSTQPRSRSAPGRNKSKKNVDYSDGGSSSDDEDTQNSRKKNKLQIPDEGRAPLAELTPHEQMIREVLVLKRPFKVPIPGYTGASFTGRTLGYRKDTGKRALYDETAPGALILYTPEPPPVGVNIVSVN